MDGLISTVSFCHVILDIRCDHCVFLSRLTVFQQINVSTGIVSPYSDLNIRPSGNCDILSLSFNTVSKSFYHHCKRQRSEIMESIFWLLWMVSVLLRCVPCVFHLFLAAESVVADCDSILTVLPTGLFDPETGIRCYFSCEQKECHAMSSGLV